MDQWEIAKTMGVCAGCGQTLTPNQDYCAALLEQVGNTGSSPGGFERRDYCLGCWERLEPEVFCFWKTRFPELAQKKKLLVDDEVLLDIFERLDGADERVKINFRFVLALILMRKRILKYQQTDYHDGQEFWVMGQVREERKHQVLNPRLDDAQIQEVSEQLSTILRSEL